MKKFAYSNNGTHWAMLIDEETGAFEVMCDGESRIYEIPDPITDMAQEGEYVYIYTEGGVYYQFKFEENRFFVGDIFDIYGEHMDAFAMYTFGEE